MNCLERDLLVAPKTAKSIGMGQMRLSNSAPSALTPRVPNYDSMGIKALAKVAGMLCKVSPLRSRSIRLICRLEGGQIWSRSFRALMHRYFGVEIGRYSYGACLWPGEVPRGTRINNFCSLASGVKIFRRNHSVTFVSLHPFFFNSSLGILEHDAIWAVEDNPLYVMDDAWIGANAIITSRCRRIGIGAVVGAGSVVLNDVPDFAIVAGNPARVIRKRFNDDLCAVILESRWWEYPLAQLMAVLPLFLEAATLENAQRLREHLRNRSPE